MLVDAVGGLLLLRTHAHNGHGEEVLEGRHPELRSIVCSSLDRRKGSVLQQGRHAGRPVEPCDRVELPQIRNHASLKTRGHQEGSVLARAAVIHFKAVPAHCTKDREAEGKGMQLGVVQELRVREGCSAQQRVGGVGDGEELREEREPAVPLQHARLWLELLWSRAASDAREQRAQRLRNRQVVLAVGGEELERSSSDQALRTARLSAARRVLPCNGHRLAWPVLAVAASAVSRHAVNGLEQIEASARIERARRDCCFIDLPDRHTASVVVGIRRSEASLSFGPSEKVPNSGNIERMHTCSARGLHFLDALKEARASQGVPQPEIVGVGVRNIGLVPPYRAGRNDAGRVSEA
mmetsp:Transcript_6220/g.14676  ORF Transcript_6220/g.14676 Transcript_6220/m.14676 type:complete len:352 (-) Transcript_6220:1449-2504(-)|eukprot:1995839-Rhodomonas_salina.2